jgi:hypothetical protein
MSIIHNAPKYRLTKLLYGVEVRGIAIPQDTKSTTLIISAVTKECATSTSAPTPVAQILKYDWSRDAFETWVGEWSESGELGTVKDGPASEAVLSSPGRITVCPNGITYFIDGTCIRQVGLDGVVRTMQATVAPPALRGAAAGDEVPEPPLINPGDLAADRFGRVYIADEGSKRIRLLDTRGGGPLTTVAGSGLCGSADGSALEATFSDFGSLTLDQVRQCLPICSVHLHNCEIAVCRVNGNGCDDIS